LSLNVWTNLRVKPWSLKTVEPLSLFLLVLIPAAIPVDTSYRSFSVFVYISCGEIMFAGF
jgi:hypothetical protein